MRFAHLADVHIGAWRDPAMRGLSVEAFRKAVDITLTKRVDFAIIAGDLFNTAVPAIDHLQESVVLLKKLKRAQIPVYIVPGSHDYNAAGKSILDVLEEAELLHNVMKGKVVDGKLSLRFTIDDKTGIKLVGLGGRRGTLESREYKMLDSKLLENEAGKKIFLFHSSLDELKPDELSAMESMKVSELPKGFDYYAGGHVHIVEKTSIPGYSNVVYPGPLFPANFSELWKLGGGGFYIFDDGMLEFIPLELKGVVKIDVKGSTPEEISNAIYSEQKHHHLSDAIVMIRTSGRLSRGKSSDVDFKAIFRELYSRGAYFVMRNTSQLQSEELPELLHISNSSDLEEEMIKTALSKKASSFEKEEEVVKELIKEFSEEQRDGERKSDYEERLKKSADKTLMIE